MQMFLIPVYLAICDMPLIFFFILNIEGGYIFTLYTSAKHLFSN